MNSSDQLDLTFSALGHPVRRAIIVRLTSGDMTVNELAEPFDLSLPAISKHIRVLEKAGLIDRRRDAQSRPCSLNPSALEKISNWTEQYRYIWEGRFDRLAQAAQQLKEPENE